MTSIDDDWIEVTFSDFEDINRPEKVSKKCLDPGLPRSNPTKSSWQIPPDPLQNFRSTDSLPTGILDVVIIGSGFSGTSIAWHLLHGDTSPRTSYHSSLMFEAREVCSGATGRNGPPSLIHNFIAGVNSVGGHLSCDFYSYYSTVEGQYNKKEAARHSHFEKLNFEAVKRLIERERIDSEFKYTGGGWDVFLTDEEFSAAKREVERMKAAGGYTSSIKVFEGEAAAKAAGVKFCKGAIFSAERASLRPYTLITSLLRILIKQHLLQLHTNTPVTSITSTTAKSKYYTIHTPRGIVKARHVINATNAWIGHLYPEFQGKIIPTRGQVIHVEGGDLSISPMGWNYGGEYLIQRPDNTLIFGGGRRFSSAKNAELGNTDDTTINSNVSHFLHTFLPSQLPLTTIQGTPPPIPSIREWTGIMGFSHDSHPYVGHDPDEPERWVIGGFHGHGMVRIFLAAKALVEHLLTGEWPEWFPEGYRYYPERRTIGEVKAFLET